MHFNDLTVLTLDCDTNGVRRGRNLGREGNKEGIHYGCPIWLSLSHPMYASSVANIATRVYRKKKPEPVRVPGGQRVLDPPLLDKGTHPQ